MNKDIEQKIQEVPKIKETIVDNYINDSLIKNYCDSIIEDILKNKNEKRNASQIRENILTGLKTKIAYCELIQYPIEKLIQNLGYDNNINGVDVMKCQVSNVIGSQIELSIPASKYDKISYRVKNDKYSANKIFFVDYSNGQFFMIGEIDIFNMIGKAAISKDGKAIFLFDISNVTTNGFALI